MDEETRKVAREMFRKHGRAGMHTGDPVTKAVLTEAEREDSNRKGFLMAIAQITDAALRMGLSLNMVCECLEGAAEGMRHVQG